MYDVLISIRDPATLDLLRAAFAERGIFRTAAAPRERLAQLLAPPSGVAVVALDLDPSKSEHRDLLASLRAVNSAVQFLAIGPEVERTHFGPSRLELDVRTFVRTPIDAFDLARRLKRLADSLVAVD